MNKFDVPRFCQLLQTEQKIRKSRQPFFYHNQEEWLELGLLRLQIRNEYYYQNSSKYFWRIKNFLETKESETRWAAWQTSQFIANLTDMYLKDDKLVRKLTHLYDRDRKFFDHLQQQKDLEELWALAVPDHSKGFLDLLEQIMDFYYSLDWTDRKNWNDELEEKFRNFVAKILITMHQYLKQE